MNRLLHLISRLGAYHHLLVAIAILVAMPYSGDLVFHAYQDYLQAKAQTEAAKGVRLVQDQRMIKLKEYKKFSSEVQTFVKSLQVNRLEESSWTSYEVEIKDRFVALAEFQTLLTHARSTSRYYFKPKRLVITSLFAKASLPPHLSKIIHGKESPGVIKSIYGDEKPPVPGEKILISLSGTYLVLPGD